ncbi:MAG TPA: hypothetical protein PK299_15375 [Anaerolineales bacterium]|nr:hypothetical protein [Anaerolineales bacterium]
MTYAACYGSGCNNSYPQNEGCDTNAVTVFTTAIFGNWSQLVNARTKPACNASWTRVYHTYSGQTRWIGASTRYGGSTYNYATSLASSAAVAPYPTIINTKMYGPSDTTDVRSCGNVSTSSVSVPIPSSSVPYSSWYNYCTNVH